MNEHGNAAANLSIAQGSVRTTVSAAATITGATTIININGGTTYDITIPNPTSVPFRTYTFRLLSAPSGVVRVVTAAGTVVIADVALLGGDFVLQSEGSTWVSAGAVAADAIASFSFAIAAGGANVSEVTITPLNAAGVAMTGIRNIEIWLSDAATGAGITGTTASGTVTAKAASGTVLTALTAKKHLIGQTVAAGTFILEITDTAKTGFYVAAAIPGGGKPDVSAQLVTASYGS